MSYLTKKEELPIFRTSRTILIPEALWHIEKNWGVNAMSLFISETCDTSYERKKTLSSQEKIILKPTKTNTETKELLKQENHQDFYLQEFNVHNLFEDDRVRIVQQIGDFYIVTSPSKSTNQIILSNSTFPSASS